MHYSFLIYVGTSHWMKQELNQMHGLLHYVNLIFKAKLVTRTISSQGFCRTQEGPADMRLSRFRSSVRPSVRPYVRLHIRFQFYPTRSIYLGPPIFLQIPDLLCIDY